MTAAGGGGATTAGGGGVTAAGGGGATAAGGGGVTALGGVTAAGGGGTVAGSAAAFGAGRVAMTIPTTIPIMTKITITITAIGGPPLGAGAAGAAPPLREFIFIYNLNSEINSSKFL